jgi:hypothetical protein
MDRSRPGRKAKEASRESPERKHQRNKLPDPIVCTRKKEKKEEKEESPKK